MAQQKIYLVGAGIAGWEGFGAKALERYGFADDAREAARRMIEVPEGLYRATGSIRENYDPQNGAGSHATDFGWSAAHLLLLFAP